MHLYLYYRKNYAFCGLVQTCILAQSLSLQCRDGNPSVKKGRNFDVELRSISNQSDSDIEIERQNRTILNC